MLKKLNYKNKIIVLGLAALVLFYLIFKLAVSETIGLHSKLSDLETKMATIENAPKEIESIQAKLNNFASILGKSIDTTYRNEPFLEFLSVVCKENNTTLADYIAPHVFNQGDFFIETRTAVIEGKFINLVSTLFAIEKKYMRGKTTSACYQVKEDFRTKQRRLYLTVMIQSITGSSENNNQTNM
jgi:hypothetical protein